MEKFPDAYGLVKHKVEVYPPRTLQRSDLERAHLPNYLNAVNRDDPRGQPHGLTTYDRNRLGLPPGPRLLERSMLETAGTVSATLAAREDGLAANLAGGTHHAFPDRGLGFCVLNDIAVAIEYLRASGQAPGQILIVDTDAHQGNANHAYFRNDPGVFTYSIHVGKNYPAVKEPGDCDVPLPRYVESLDYLEALQASLPPVFAATEPDLVFWISGADCHSDDRFGQMRLSHEAIAERDHCVLELCREYGCTTPGAGTVLVYGGGYQPKPGMTGWIHAQTVLRTARTHETGPA
ncbi:histone deacetylase family protein [Coraliomargarita parva]|uniref:histone deacetylase family protein n=1 Tax=Coraliomargarita parva TaxID=3014050 RepID=UPI0022B2B9FE|nr:histone deacetylase [Coraliomargarita parva]